MLQHKLHFCKQRFAFFTNGLPGGTAHRPPVAWAAGHGIIQTSSRQAGADEIIEVAAVRFRGETVDATFQRLVRPRYSLPIKIAQLTGIAQSELEAAPAFHQIAPELVR